MDEESALKIGNYSFSGKNLIVIGLILVGLFFAWVLFHRGQASTTTSAATDTTGATSSDGSALDGLQTSLNNLAQAEAAQNTQLAGIAANANSAARDASGARTDASSALNGVNKLLNSGGTPKPAPKPAPAPGKPPAKTTTVAASQTKTVGSTTATTKNTVTTKPPAGKGSSVSEGAWHITAAGLGLN